MSDRTYARFFRNGVPRSTNLEDAIELAEKVNDFLAKETVKKAISTVHLLGASSHKVQAAIIKEVEALGFQSEKKGLFANVDVSGIRPDYFKAIEGGGVLFEVERGKTLANNMDLLDVWKTHICLDAKHLFLMVPLIRVTNKGAQQKVFNTVEKRVGAFFAENVGAIDVDSVHVFGY
jgi:hypothetical protein